MNTSPDQYFIDGCGRCSLGGTPKCKVHTWAAELALLRSLIQNTELTEECKWGVPCYTLDGKNVLMLSAFKEYCCISFLKGALLKDDKNLLTKQGEYGQSGRLVKITTIDEIVKYEQAIVDFIDQAITNEKAGLKVETRPNPEPIPEELQAVLIDDPTFRDAFFALTPGRQRGYIIHFSQPKQSKTRIARIEKYTPQILNGEGMHDAYKNKTKAK